MGKPTQKLLHTERLPDKGAKAALLTKNGIIGGVVTSWSVAGAVVEARGEVVPGEKVRIRVQGPDKIWEKRATVLWVNRDQGFAVEFEPDGSARKGDSSVIPRIRQFLYSMRPPTKPDTKESATKAKRSEIQLPGKDVQDRRSHRRLPIETGAQIMWLGSPLEQDVARITDASRSGVLFTTSRAYPLGTKLQVQFPYPNSTSPKRQGNVVRVEKLPNGLRSVAVAFG